MSCGFMSSTDLYSLIEILYWTKVINFMKTISHHLKTKYVSISCSFEARFCVKLEDLRLFSLCPFIDEKMTESKDIYLNFD